MRECLEQRYNTGLLKNQFVRHEDWLRFVKWVAVCWIVVFWKLGEPALMDPDEAHYAQLTREMLRAENWMIPLLDGLPYIDKPVLFHWLQGIAIAALGETELAMRLPSAVAAVALFWTTRWLGRQLFEDERLGVRAWLMLATMPLTFALASIGVFDMLFTAFLFGSIAVGMVAALRNRAKLQYLSYVLLSLAVMTKGPVALVLAGFFFVGGVLCGGECRSKLLALNWIKGAALSVALSLPWFVWMYYALGWHFVHQYAIAGNLYYLTQPESFSNRGFNHTLYVSTFLAGFFPWSFVMMGGAIDTVRRWRAKVTVPPEELLLWVWVGVVFGIFSLARFKVDRYVYPAAPACCLLAARAWLSVSAIRSENALARDNLFARGAIALLALVLVVLGAVGAVSLFDLGLPLPGAAAIIPAALAAGGLAITTTLVRRKSVTPVLFGSVLTMLLLVFGTVVVVGFPILASAWPTAAVAEQVRAQVNEEDRVALYRLERWRFSLRYYLDRPVSRLSDTASLRKFLDEDGRYVLLLDEDFKRLQNEGVNLRPVVAHKAVTGTVGRGLRRQRWGSLVVATTDDTPRTTGSAAVSVRGAQTQRDWQEGILRDVKIDRPKVSFGVRSGDPTSSIPRTTAARETRTYIIENPDLRLEIRLETTADAPHLEASIGDRVSFAVEKKIVYVKDTAGKEHRLTLRKQEKIRR